MSELPTSMKRHQGTNKYYLLPVLFGLLGLFFHAKKRGQDFMGLLALFIITGLGIIVYSNQPPNEPRERDYVLVGSFFTFAMWIGMAVLALFEIYRERVKSNFPVGALAATAIVLTAPFLMGFQMNLSLIAVDWYINQLNRKVNDSPPIKLTLTPEQIRGYKRNQVFVDPYKNGPRMSIKDAIKFVNEDHPVPVSSGRTLESYLPTSKFSIPVNRSLVQQNNIVKDLGNVVDAINFDINKSYVLKG